MNKLSCIKKFFPKKLIQQAVKLLPNSPLERKIRWDTINRPAYSYGTYHAALQARGLGINKISVIEFGVAGGNGLVALERIAKEVSKETGVQVHIYGFDSGSGMPEPIDYRDMPYVWQAGFFKLDIELLNQKIKDAKLILGDVAETVAQFTDKYKPSPIGFISFDLDYYSSTIAALKLFDSDQSFILPRVFCYFDDCIGDDWELHSPYTGELLAIKEFNKSYKSMKLAKINGLFLIRQIPAPWNHIMSLVSGLGCYKSL